MSLRYIFWQVVISTLFSYFLQYLFAEEQIENYLIKNPLCQTVYLRDYLRYSATSSHFFHTANFCKKSSVGAASFFDFTSQ